MMESVYDTKEWAGKTKLGQRLFIYNFSMLGDEFSSWELVNSVVTKVGPAAAQKVYIWRNTKAEDEQLVHISIVERTYWQHAQLQLKEELEHCMRPDIPAGKGKAARIGDIQFVGDHLDTKLNTAVFFSRGNLQISVRSVGKTPVDVLGFAQKIDDRIVKAPTKAEEKRGVAKKMKPLKLSVEKSTKAVVVDNLSAAVPAAGWLRIICDEGELRRDGNTLSCVYPKGGKKEIELMRYGEE